MYYIYVPTIMSLPIIKNVFFQRNFIYSDLLIIIMREILFTTKNSNFRVCRLCIFSAWALFTKLNFASVLIMSFFSVRETSKFRRHNIV